MSSRSLFFFVLAVYVAACGGAAGGSRSGSSSGSSLESAAPGGTVSIEWLKQRPPRSPWGPEDIPANRKPKWFCVTDVARPEASYCARTLEACQSQQGPSQCEAHARAACASDMGGCYPTLAICESVRKVAASDRARGAHAADEVKAECAYSD